MLFLLLLSLAIYQFPKAIGYEIIANFAMESPECPCRKTNLGVLFFYNPIYKNISNTSCAKITLTNMLNG